jgi:signal transduction histidine kinase
LVLIGVAFELRSLGPAAALVVCAYTVTTLSPIRTVVPVLGGVAAVHAAGGVVLSRFGGDTGGMLTYWQVSGTDPGAVALATLASFGAVAGVGSVVRDRRRRMAELVARAELLEAEREERDRVAAAEERSRIARELHDIAAHDLSAIVVQAGAADRLVDADPVRARAVLHEIRKQGRQSLAAMRQLVGVLRHDDTPGRRPPPGLHDLADLLAVAKAAGMVVDVTTTGTPSDLPALVDLTAFRVIQEALTNARRHAPGAAVRVRVAYGSGPELSIVVDNDRPAARPPAEPAGHGLIGMRERVRQVKGTLRVGHTADGGWQVAAWLPTTMEETA